MDKARGVSNRHQQESPDIGRLAPKDALRCSGCAVGGLCVAAGSDAATLSRLDEILRTDDSIDGSRIVIRKGDPFNGLIAVRSGCFKSFTIDRDGREQVQGFHFPGELIGLDAIDGKRHRADVIALGSAGLCSLDYSQLLQLSSCSDGLRDQLFRLFSSKLANQNWRTGDYTADERIAAFLLDISERLERRGCNSEDFELLMSRSDIGNYLGLATETVSRVFGRFNTNGYITVKRKRVIIDDRDGLSNLADAVLEQL